MAASSAVVPLAKVEKKIAQISRVIQHLNAKSDDSDLDSLAGSYENEIEGILRDASERVRRFHAASQHKHDNARLEARAEEIEAKYEAQRVKALKEIEAFKKRAGAQLRKTAPPEVLAALEAAGQDAGTLSCPLCKAMHAGHLAGNSHFVAPLAVSPTRAPTLRSEPRVQHAGFLIHPRPRGPPAWA